MEGSAPGHGGVVHFRARPSVSCPVERCIIGGVDLAAAAGNRAEDLFGGIVPDECFGVQVPGFGPCGDARCERSRKAAVAQ